MVVVGGAVGVEGFGVVGVEALFDEEGADDADDGVLFFGGEVFESRHRRAWGRGEGVWGGAGSEGEEVAGWEAEDFFEARNRLRPRVAYSSFPVGNCGLLDAHLVSKPLLIAWLPSSLHGLSKCCHISSFLPGTPICNMGDRQNLYKQNYVAVITFLPAPLLRYVLCG